MHISANVDKSEVHYWDLIQNNKTQGNKITAPKIKTNQISVPIRKQIYKEK